MSWIDVSMPCRAGMVCWPGDPYVDIRQVMDMERGDSRNLTHLQMSAHTGTHMDAPRHFTQTGASMSAWEPACTVGPCRVIAIDDPVAIRAAELARHEPRAGEILFFKTQNSAFRYQTDSFQQDFVYLANDAAQLLAAAGVRTIGIDYLSIGGFHQDLVETHVTILSAGIWAIEGLMLGDVEAGDYDLCCLPLRLEGADGAPARALLRKR